MEIRETDLAEVWRLRKEVMYPEKEIAFVQLPEDSKGLHLGLYIKKELVSVISLFFNGREMQFRKFATKTKEQGKGYGTALLNRAFQLAKEKNVKSYGAMQEEMP